MPLPQRSSERPLSRTHFGSGCPGTLQRRRPGKDGYCPRCGEVLPNVYRRGLSALVEGVRPSRMPDQDRAVANGYADFTARLAAERAHSTESPKEL